MCRLTILQLATQAHIGEFPMSRACPRASSRTGTPISLSPSLYPRPKQSDYILGYNHYTPSLLPSLYPRPKQRGEWLYSRIFIYVSLQTLPHCHWCFNNSRQYWGHSHSDLDNCAVKNVSRCNFLHLEAELCRLCKLIVLCTPARVLCECIKLSWYCSYYGNRST